MFKLKKNCRVKTTLYVIWFLVGLCVLRRLTNGEKFYHLSFEYPTKDLNNIINDIETKGGTYARPLNNVTEQYSFIVDPLQESNFKHEFEKLEMIFVVKSFAGNTAQRAAIRNTWGKSNLARMRTIFVLGYIQHMQALIEEEDKLYKDILQLNMEDKYDNLVYKTVYSILWLYNHNINTKSVHFLDDDRLVNTNKLISFALDNLYPREMKMIGYKVKWRMPFRSTDSKWFISLSEYPYDFWPPYLIGGTILTNMDVVKRMAEAIPFTKIIRMEDTFVGILAKILNIKLEHNSGFLPYFISGTELKNELSSPDYRTYNTIVQGWKLLHS